MPGPLAIAGALAIGSTIARGISALRDTAVNTIPKLDDEVTVEVLGHPGASKQQLYFLALAAANGMVKRFSPLLNLNPLVAPVMGMLMIEYDAADNWVRCTLRYQTSTLAAATTGARRSTYYNDLAVYRGPQCAVVGERFDFTSKILPGIPSSSVAEGGSGPDLPFEKQTILTQCPEVMQPAPKPLTVNPAISATPQATIKIPSPNPKPPGDNRSRGVVLAQGSEPTSPSSAKCCTGIDKLIPLVFAALTDPGGVRHVGFELPTPGPTGS